MLLAGCARSPVPVEESGTRAAAPVVAGDAAGSTQQVPGRYTVRKGDTLYSIAWRHGLDFRALARLNGIGEPYLIHPGQNLRLRADDKPVAAGKPARPAKPATPPARPAAPAAPAAPQAASPAAPPASTAATAPPPAATSRGGWQWPARGPLLSGFSATRLGPKGIAIGGNTGDPVRAARAGRVVYTGSGLVGYGQLVIIKHDDVYLSAYAHNSRLLVKEGDQVQAGQVIAAMGSTGTDRTRLHFEVRRNGDPIDPMVVLPRP